MGREAAARAIWRGAEAEVRALLEGDALILRGALKLRLARQEVQAIAAEGDSLHLLAGGEPLVLILPPGQAPRWLRALQAPPPLLADKLGLVPGLAVCLLGDPPPELAAALSGTVPHPPQGAALILAVLAQPSDLAGALAAGQADVAQTGAQPEGQARPGGVPVWCVHGKGRTAAVTDAAVRSAFRAAGWVDTKSCAVSALWSATLYRPRRP